MLAQRLGALGGDGAPAGAATSGGSAEGGAGGEGGAQPEVSSLVDVLMQQLLSKEVLYQPMKVGAGVGGWGAG